MRVTLPNSHSSTNLLVRRTGGRSSPFVSPQHQAPDVLAQCASRGPTYCLCWLPWRGHNLPARDKTCLRSIGLVSVTELRPRARLTFLWTVGSILPSRA